MSTFTPKEKERIFIERTQDLYPQNWTTYKELIQHELWTQEELQDYNFKQRVSILKFAYNHSVFYKRLYDEAGLKPEDIKTEEDWNAVPIVTKQMVADYSKEIEVKDVIEKYGFAAHTGGSTGKPLRIFRDRRHFWQGPYWRFYGWYTGRKPGELLADTPVIGMDQAYLDRSQYRMSPEELKNKSRIFWPIEYFYLSPYSEFNEQVEGFINAISKSPVVRIYAYAGALDMFAEYCLEHGKEIHNISFIEACASPVNQVLRDKVRKAFDCRIFDFYASNEMGPMAIECHESGQHHHLHVLSDLLHLELVDENGHLVEGENIGTTIVTSFTNRVFPFIKYNHGDKTHWIKQPCKCGLPFPCIAPVSGRCTEFLCTKKGFKIDGVGFNEIFDFYPQAAKQFQFRQHKNGEVTLYIVPNLSYANHKDEILHVFNKLQTDFKDEITFSLKYTDFIPNDGGKIRYIVHD